MLKLGRDNGVVGVKLERQIAVRGMLTLAGLSPAVALFWWRMSAPKVPETVSGRDGVGLCSSCKHVRLIDSDKGSRFYLCLLSATDPQFPKYPRLPVIRCSGYAPRSPA
jgi:hypothetical protein